MTCVRASFSTAQLATPVFDQAGISPHSEKTLVKSKSCTDFIRLNKIVPDASLQTFVDIPPNQTLQTTWMRGAYYRRHGAGPLDAMVVIIPGTGQTAQTYDQQARTLVNLTDKVLGVLVCNKMGHGDSDGNRGVFQREIQFTGMIKLFLEVARSLADGSSFEANHAQQVSLLMFGQSLGGLLALNALSRFGAQLSIKWGSVSTVLHNPWLNIREDRQPLPWQQKLMDLMVSLNENAVVCRSGSVLNSLYASFISTSFTTDEHSLVGITTMRIAQELGDRFQENAQHVNHDVTVVVSPEDELIDPKATLDAFKDNPFARLFQWHTDTGADHNHNKTPLGAMVLRNLIYAQLFDIKHEHFLLESVLNLN